MDDDCILPKPERQTVECLSRTDDLPALFQMKYEKLPPMKMKYFKKIANQIASNQTMDKIEETVWQSLKEQLQKKVKFIFAAYRNNRINHGINGFVACEQSNSCTEGNL